MRHPVVQFQVHAAELLSPSQFRPNQSGVMDGTVERGIKMFLVSFVLFLSSLKEADSEDVKITVFQRDSG